MGIVHFPWSARMPLCGHPSKRDTMSKDESVVTCPSCKQALHEWRYHSVGTAIPSNKSLSDVLFEAVA